MKIIQSILIAIFILLVPFIAYIWMMGYPLKVGYYSIYLYTFLVFLLVLYPVRNTIDKKIPIVAYFKQLGLDVYMVFSSTISFLFESFKALIKPFTNFKKQKK
jgi:predicted neutral ceramidase superfamily lipid hydrolase